MHTSRDVTALLRVETLAGIGWMLSRKIYDDLRLKWRRLDDVGNEEQFSIYCIAIPEIERYLCNYVDILAL